MYTMTYSSLLKDVRAYLERGFTLESDKLVFEQLPNLITLGERRCARELKLLGYIRAMTTPLQVGVPVYLKPDRWRKTISMRVGETFVFPRSYEYIRNYWSDESSLGVPEFYADYDYQHWIFAPTPISTAELEVLYYEQPAFLSDENQSNWLVEYAPDLILYASLLEAQPFLKNDGRIATWQSLYDRSKQALDDEDNQRAIDRNVTRSED